MNPGVGGSAERKLGARGGGPALLLLAGMSVATLFGQEATPSFRAGTRVVEVGLIATRGDKGVDDLREQDLKVFDNNKLQKIVSFEKVGAGGAGTDASGSGRATNNSARPERLTYVVLDAINTSFADQIFGREGLSKMLGQLAPGEKIEILALGDTLHLLHSFSSDYESLRWSVEKYEGSSPRTGNRT